jgi:hypothetical protein
MLREIEQIEIGAMTAWRKTQATGERALALEATQVEKERKTTIAPGGGDAETQPADQAATMDGAMVHVRQEGWKELKIGCIYELEVQPCAKTNRLGDVLDEVRAQAPSFVMHLGGPEAFGLKV